MPTPTQIVSTAVGRLFGQKDATVIDELFGPRYTQHSALGVDGLEGVRALVARLPEAFSYELVRILADDDLVLTHGIYIGFGPVPVVGFDVWRVQDGRIVEHWDALSPAGTDARSAVDGAVESSFSADADRSRSLVRSWLAAAVGGQELPAAGVEHPPARAADGGGLDYRTVHQVIAQGDLVFARSEGQTAVPVVVNDLWRLEGDSPAEHWSLIAPVPAELPHDNGVF